jgi:hypothetical protein
MKVDGSIVVRDTKMAVIEMAAINRRNGRYLLQVKRLVCVVPYPYIRLCDR